MSNITLRESSFIRNLDTEVAPWIRFTNVLVSIPILVFNGFSLIAINRTSHIPRTAKYLSSTLLVFDFVAVFMYTVRKLIDDGKYNLMVQFLAIGWSFVAYFNIAVMSLERLVVFQWPNYYLREFSFFKFRNMCFALWTTYIMAYTSWVVTCFAIFRIEATIRKCYDNVIYSFILGTFPLSAIIPCTCLSKITFLIQKQSKKISTLPNYKSTATVFMCGLNCLITAIFYAVILIVTVTDNKERRVYMDIVMIANCFTDTCVYVLWYKECRLQMLKIMAKMFPSLGKGIEKMRIEIFDIQTYSSNSA